MSLLDCPTCAPIPEWDWLEANGHEPLSFSYTASGGAVCVIGPTQAVSLAWWASLDAPPEIVRGSPVRLLVWLAERLPPDDGGWNIRGALERRAADDPPETGWLVGKLGST